MASLLLYNLLEAFSGQQAGIKYSGPKSRVAARRHLWKGASNCRLAQWFTHFGWTNHLEEKLLDQVQAQTPYTPPHTFGGHSHSIPQDMILDV